MYGLMIVVFVVFTKIITCDESIHHHFLEAMDTLGLTREEIAALSQFKGLDESWQSGMRRAIMIYEEYTNHYGPWPDDYGGIVSLLLKNRTDYGINDNVPQYFARIIAKIKTRGYCPSGRYNIDCLIDQEQKVHPNMYGIFGGQYNNLYYRDHVFWNCPHEDDEIW
jgi:hypothetical protein